MNINQNIFRSYDIRGVYPKDFNDVSAYNIGRYFVEYTKAKKVVVGRDMRISSPSLFQALSKGITEAGADVCSLGEVPTEVLYFAVVFYNYDAGIMITASHNPKEYNGLKMLKREESEIKVIRGKDMAGVVDKKEFSSQKIGEIKNQNVWEDYLNHVLSFVELDKIDSFKVVADTGNGMAGKGLSFLKSKLPVEIIPVNFDLDGNFPNRSPNPLEEGAEAQVAEEILENKADLGCMFDGDGDRVFLFDEKGNRIRADVTLLILARYFLKKQSDSAIVYNNVCSKAVPEFIKKWGGKPVRAPVGFVNVREKMIENRAVVGGELSGHYSFKDNFYLDSGLISLLILLQVISESGKPVSELASELSPYAKGSEINFEVEDKEKIMDKVREKYSDGEQDSLDGITVSYNDWWFNLRPSNTEPVLRLTIEAESEDVLKEKEKELKKIISE